MINCRQLNLAVSIIVISIFAFAGQGVSDDADRCTDNLNKGCLVADLGSVVEFGIKRSNAFGLHGGLGYALVDNLVLSFDAGPVWTGSFTRLDTGLRVRYVIDVDRPYAVSVGYWVGGSWVPEVNSSSFRHVPEFSFIGEITDKISFGAFAGIALAHNNGTKTAISFIPTLTFSF